MGGGWSNGSVVRQLVIPLVALTEDPAGFDFQDPNDSSQSSVTLVPGHPMPSSGLHENQVHTWHTDISRPNVHTDK